MLLSLILHKLFSDYDGSHSKFAKKKNYGSNLAQKREKNKIKQIGNSFDLLIGPTRSFQWIIPINLYIGHIYSNNGIFHHRCRRRIQHLRYMVGIFRYLLCFNHQFESNFWLRFYSIAYLFLSFFSHKFAPFAVCFISFSQFIFHHFGFDFITSCQFHA